MEQEENKGSAGKIAMMSCLIAIGALFTVGVMAVVGSVLFLGNGSSSANYQYNSVEGGSDESPFEDFAPVEPEEGAVPDFFDSLNEDER